MSNYDYWATHSFLHSRQFDEKVVIDYLLGNQKNPYGQEIPDLSARVGLSALALGGDKEYARTGTRREAGGLASLYQKEYMQAYLRERKEQCLALLNQAPDLSLLPVGSFALQFEFMLTRPYISKDDVTLHLLDNPVKKEWVFKLPYVAATQWKGSLRHALWQMGHKEEESDLIQRLFGTANDNDGTGKQGRLYFYPTFFDQLGLEVINPHDRATGAGSNPILMECVPSGATGAFTLLYTPLDRIGKDKNKVETRQQVFADLQLVAQGVQAMLTLYGFGAKTSSGFGLAELTGQGQLLVHYPDKAEQNPKPQEPLYPAEVKDFLGSYPAEYLDKKLKELQLAGVPNALRQRIKEIKAAYLTYQQEVADYQKALVLWEATASTPPPPMTVRVFTCFTALQEIIVDITNRS